MSEIDPGKIKLKKIMSKEENKLEVVSKKYWDTIYKGVLDYLFDLKLITNKKAVQKAIIDYIRHQGSHGPQPMWGSP
ncbi:MAG: hypothetical protein ACE5R6_13890 [Candidatus Heimdallarchaeota archaeon]